MSILDKATTGPRKRGQKIVLPAEVGAGKTYFAGKLPNHFIIDLEGSASQLKNARVLHQEHVRTLEQFKDVLKELKLKPKGFADSVVIDTGDYMANMIAEYVVRNGGKDVSTLADFGWGKGYQLVEEETAEILSALDAITERGMHVLMLCHVAVTSFQPPGAAGAYNRYEISMDKRPLALIKAWADAILFGYHDLIISKDGTTGKYKATGGKERILQCQWTPAADAKNRHGLNPVEPWNLDTVEKMLGHIGMTLGPYEDEDAKPAGKPGLKPPPQQQAKKPQAPATQPASAKVPSTQASIPVNEVTPDKLREVIEGAGIGDAVTAIYRKRGTLSQEQDWTALPVDIAATILKNPDAFVKFARKADEADRKESEREADQKEEAKQEPATQEPDEHQASIEAAAEESVPVIELEPVTAS